MNDAAGSRVGSTFGRYHLKRLLGRGGMGEVYEAEDTVKERVVALKLMTAAYSQDPVFRERLKREAKTAGRLHEPHVVPIHDWGDVDGQLYVEMRMIEGTDLGTMLSRFGPLSPARAVAILRQIASALDAAHEVGVMHRDVKPGNILITRDDFAYLVDFGIANAATDEKLTQMGDLVGTYAYMAPERFTGDSDAVSGRADVYALACVLFESLTGAPPYRGVAAGVMTAHLTQPAPRPSGLRPGISKAFDQVIARGMAKKPEDRYATAGDLAHAAHNALTTPDQDRAEDILNRSQVATLPHYQPSAGAAPATLPAQPPPSRATPPPTHGPAWQTPAPYPVAPAQFSTPPPRGVGGAVGNTPPGGLRPATTPPPPPPGQSWPPPAGPAPSFAFGAPPWTAPQPPPTERKPKWWLIIGGAAAAVVVLVVGVVVFWPGEPAPPPPPPDARTVEVVDDGVQVGNPAAPTTIDVFNEPICPACGDLVTSSASDLEQAVQDEKIAVRYHLLDFLNNRSASGDYSTRAGAASLCVADNTDDPKIYQAFYSGLFAPSFQPAEDAGIDRTDADLVDLAERVGAPSQVKTCIESGHMINTAVTKAEDAEATLAKLAETSNWSTPAVYEGRTPVDTSAGWVDSLG